MKVEEYAYMIFQAFQDDKKKFISMMDILGKMKGSKVLKYRINYHRVCQTLGEIGLSVAIDNVLDLQYDTNSDHCKPGLLLLATCMTNTAAVRKVLTFYAELCDILREAIFTEDSQKFGSSICKEDVMCSLTILYRGLLLGSKEAFTALWYTYITDILPKVQRACLNDIDARDPFSPEGKLAILIASLNAKIATYVFKHSRHYIEKDLCKEFMGNAKAPAIIKALFNVEKVKSHFTAPLLLPAYVLDCLRNFQWCCSLFEERNDSPTENKCPNLLSMSRADRLAKMELGGEYYVFCSQPGCQKQEQRDKLLEHCGDCMLARYCSKLCQEQHWKDDHKKLCSKWM